MLRNIWLPVMFVTVLYIGLGTGHIACSADVKESTAASSIHIDIPVVLKKANVVFNMDHLAFAGDLPIGINYMHLLANRFKEQGTKGQIIGIFHSDAAYMTLNDNTYNTYRNVSTGNPYKGLIAELIKQGVQIEECAVSMKTTNGAMKICCRA